jgi:hypothetical protein
MAGAAFFGFLLGSGLWFVALILLALHALFTAFNERMGYLIFLYQRAHPYNAARARRNTLIFWSAWATVVALIIACHYAS